MSILDLLICTLNNQVQVFYLLWILLMWDVKRTSYLHCEQECEKKFEFMHKLKFSRNQTAIIFSLNYCTSVSYIKAFKPKFSLLQSFIMLVYASIILLC